MGITAAENLTPDSLLHREEKESFLEYLIYFLMHEPGVIPKTNKQDSASAEMIRSNNECDEGKPYFFFFFPHQVLFPKPLCYASYTLITPVLLISHHIHV